jgi:hypothetical protein
MKIKYITNNVQDYSVVYDKVVHLVVFQNKNTTMSEHFQNPERGKIGTPSTQIHDRSLSWLGTPSTQIHDRSLSWLGTPSTQIHDRSLSWLGTPSTQIHDRSLSWLGTVISIKQVAGLN